MYTHYQRFYMFHYSLARTSIAVLAGPRRRARARVAVHVVNARAAVLARLIVRSTLVNF